MLVGNLSVRNSVKRQPLNYCFNEILSQNFTREINTQTNQVKPRNKAL